jgi:hypothetical protein
MNVCLFVFIYKRQMRWRQLRSFRYDFTMYHDSSFLDSILIISMGYECYLVLSG